MDTSPDFPQSDERLEKPRATRHLLGGAAILTAGATAFWLLSAGVFGPAAIVTGTLPATVHTNVASTSDMTPVRANCVTLALVRNEKATRVLPCDPAHDSLHHHEGTGRQDLAALSDDFAAGIARAISRSESD